MVHRKLNTEKTNCETQVATCYTNIQNSEKILKETIGEVNIEH